MEVFFIALFALLVGVGFALWGYRVFLVLLPIWGFFAGLWLGAETINLLLGEGFLATTTGWVVGLFTGLLFAVLSYLFYIVGVALVAASIGAALVSGILGWIGLDGGIIVFGLSLVGAIVVAGLTLALNLQKYVIIILTAVTGANGIVLAILLILGRVEILDLTAAGSAIRPILNDSPFWAIAWLALAIGGIVYQIRSNREYSFKKDQYVENWA